VALQDRVIHIPDGGADADHTRLHELYANEVGEHSGVLDRRHGGQDCAKLTEERAPLACAEGSGPRASMPFGMKRSVRIPSITDIPTQPVRMEDPGSESPPSEAGRAGPTGNGRCGPCQRSALPRQSPPHYNQPVHGHTALPGVQTATTVEDGRRPHAPQVACRLPSSCGVFELITMRT